jgi:tetratricopeptide (TPR) repeat protein
MPEHPEIPSSLLQQIEHLRHAVKSCQSEDPGRTNLYVDLAICLWRYYKQTDSLEAHEEMFEVSRELAAGTWTSPSWLLCCANLALLLKSRYEKDLSDVMILDQAIELGRATVEICSLDDKARADSCILLASLLDLRYDQTGYDFLLAEAVELERQALDACFTGHPSRSTACGHLALSLKKRYKQIGDSALFDEAITLEREALALRPSHHPDRYMACKNLAQSLILWYGMEDANQLNEIIELEHEVLALLPADHPDRAIPCTNLALCLKTRCRRTGDISLLDEAIALEREALNYRSTIYRHDQAVPCVNLAMSLIMRYEHTGDASLLNESIELGKTAVSLSPVGHSERATTCSNLAVSLRTCYAQTKNIAFLDEAIKLDREAYDLCPAHHFSRSSACGNLATSVAIRYDQTGEVGLLDEAIKLHREALDLRPVRNPDRAESCLNLAVSLTMHYHQSEDVVLLDEVIKLHEQALQCGLTNDAWRSLGALCSIHLLPRTPYFSLQQAIGYLQRSCENPVDNLQIFMVEVTKRLRTIWLFPNRWTSETTASLLGIYAELIDRLPMMAGFLLDTPSRLQTLRSFSHIGRDACIAAVQVKRPCDALELLDHAHGVVWAQALHQRDPPLRGVSPELAQELRNLLHAIAVPMQSSGLVNSHRTAQDVRHAQNTRIQVILREIRALPGLERFMRGSTFDMLRNAAHEHAVVVLVEAHGYVFAVIMSSSSQEGPDVLPLDWTQDDTQLLADFAGQIHAKYRVGSRDLAAGELHQDVPLADLPGSDRSMKPGNWRASHPSPLAKLWSAVVKPVLTHLGLVVRVRVFICQELADLMCVRTEV